MKKSNNALRVAAMRDKAEEIIRCIIAADGTVASTRLRFKVQNKQKDADKIFIVCDDSETQWDAYTISAKLEGGRLCHEIVFGDLAARVITAVLFYQYKAPECMSELFSRGDLSNDIQAFRKLVYDVTRIDGNVVGGITGEDFAAVLDDDKFIVNPEKLSLQLVIDTSRTIMLARLEPYINSEGEGKVRIVPAGGIALLFAQIYQDREKPPFIKTSELTITA